MTHSAVPVLRLNPEIAAVWLPCIHSRCYDPAFRPASQKQGVLLGMGMTEKQGGSDVRTNITRAEPLANRECRVTGHKWFCSAPMCDAFLVLAEAPDGLSCILLPRWTPDGCRNAFHLERLKANLGNRSNAPSEVEFHNAWAQLLGEEGRGVATIIDMVQHTRLDCVIASAALMPARSSKRCTVLPSPRLRPVALRSAAHAQCPRRSCRRIGSRHAARPSPRARFR